MYLNCFYFSNRKSQTFSTEYRETLLGDASLRAVCHVHVCTWAFWLGIAVVCMCVNTAGFWNQTGLIKGALIFIHGCVWGCFNVLRCIVVWDKIRIMCLVLTSSLWFVSEKSEKILNCRCYKRKQKKKQQQHKNPAQERQTDKPWICVGRIETVIIPQKAWRKEMGCFSAEDPEAPPQQKHKVPKQDDRAPLPELRLSELSPC